MKVIIAGPRDLNPDFDTVLQAVERSGFDVTEVVSGGANGVDAAGEELARVYEIPLKVIRPRWNSHGKAAGPIRNRAMAGYADALVIIKRVGVSTAGTGNMALEARMAGIPVHVEEVEA